MKTVEHLPYLFVFGACTNGHAYRWDSYHLRIFSRRVWVSMYSANPYSRYVKCILMTYDGMMTMILSPIYAPYFKNVEKRQLHKAQKIVSWFWHSTLCGTWAWFHWHQYEPVTNTEHNTIPKTNYPHGIILFPWDRSIIYGIIFSNTLLSHSLHNMVSTRNQHKSKELRKSFGHNKQTVIS